MCIVQNIVIENNCIILLEAVRKSVCTYKKIPATTAPVYKAMQDNNVVMYKNVFKK